MNRNLLLRVCLCVLVIGLVNVALQSDAKAGLFDRLRGGGCCEVTCCEPVCCETSCCDPCGRRLFRRNRCCEQTCCEPTCCEQTCCEPVCCEQTCCEPACDNGCCKKRFRRNRCGRRARGNCCCETSCGCGGEVVSPSEMEAPPAPEIGT